MAITTALNLVIASLQDLNLVPDGGGTADPLDVALAFDRLNDLLDHLKNEGLMVNTITRTTWTLTASVASYTVGSTGTIAIDRPQGPNAIANIGFIDTSLTPNAEYLFDAVLTEDAYQAIPFKSLTAPLPAAFYYNPTLPTGTLKPFPIPTQASLLGVIYAPAPLGEFVAQSDTLVFPQGWRRYIRNQLTIEIAPAFERQPPQAVVLAASDARAAIKRMNTRLQDISFDIALTGGDRPSNVYTG